MSACVLVAGATAPGTQASSEAMMAIGFLMPRRRASGVSPWISAASKAASAGCSGACRRSSDTVMCGSASISCRVKSACEPSISAAITMEKPTPVATPATATSVWRTRKRTCVRAMSRTRFMRALRRLRSTARTRWPSRRSAGGRAKRRSSPSVKPETISTLRVPRMPTSTCRRRTRLALDDEHPRALHGIGRHQQGIRPSRA